MTRELKKAELLRMIGAFLEEEIGDGYGYPTVEDDDKERLNVIIRQLIDLKFKRDADNDSVLDFEISNRKTHTFVAEQYKRRYEGDRTVPSSEWVQHIHSQMTTAQNLTNSLAEIQRFINFETAQLMAAVRKLEPGEN